MHDAPTPQEIEALLARVPEGYTPGPWHAEDTNGPLGVHGRRAPIGIWAQVLFDAALSLEDPDVDPQDEAWICGTHCRTGDADDANAGLMALAPELVTALRALAEERDRLAARSYTLAVAIMGGEDAPGYADSVDAETLVEQLREDRRRDGSEIDRLAYERSAIGVTERERIARMLEHEAEMLPCAEDAAVTRANAMLVRGDGSYDEAEGIEARIVAAERERDRLAAENARLLGLLWFAWSEFNAIRARHGAPITSDGMHTCAPDWWDAMTEAFAEAIGEDAQKPWPGEQEAPDAE